MRAPTAQFWLRDTGRGVVLDLGSGTRSFCEVSLAMLLKIGAQTVETTATNAEAQILL